MKNKIFVAGATGFQGANIAGQLLAEGYEVTTLKRFMKQGTPPMPGLNITLGGLENVEALNNVLKGVSAAVYSFPLIFDINLAKEYTSNFIAAAIKQGVGLVIFNSGFDLPKENNDLLAINLKVEIKSMLDATSLNVTTLVPDIYIDNISAPWSIPVVLNNKIVPYPVAGSHKFPWISHVDLGKYVVSAVTKPELAGQTLPIGGNLHTGEEIAAAISSEINETIRFVSITPDNFEQQIAPAFGDLAGKEISNLYRYVAENREYLISKDYKKTQGLLGVTPQSLIEWVKSVKWEL